MSHLLLTAHMDDEFVFFAPLLCTKGAIDFCVSATETSAPRRMEWENFQRNLSNVFDIPKFSTFHLQDDYSQHLDVEALTSHLFEFCKENNVTRIYTHSMFGEVGAHWHHIDCALVACSVGKLLSIPVYGLYWGGWLDSCTRLDFCFKYKPDFEKALTVFAQSYISEWEYLQDNYSISSCISFGPMDVDMGIHRLTFIQQDNHIYDDSIFAKQPDIWTFDSSYERFKQDNFIKTCLPYLQSVNTIIDVGSNDGTLSFKMKEACKSIASDYICVEQSKVYDAIYRQAGVKLYHSIYEIPDHVFADSSIGLVLSQVIYYMDVHQIRELIAMTTPKIICVSQNEYQLNKRLESFYGYRLVHHVKQPGFVGLAYSKEDKNMCPIETHIGDETYSIFERD